MCPFGTKADFVLVLRSHFLKACSAIGAAHAHSELLLVDWLLDIICDLKLTNAVEGCIDAGDLEAGQTLLQQLLDPEAEALLARLRPMAIVREETPVAGNNDMLWEGPRYITHPLVREVAAEMLASCGPEECMQARRAFARFMLSCGQEMRNAAGADMEAQLVTQELLTIELTNFEELARLLAELTCKFLSPQHLEQLVSLAALLWEFGQLVAAAELGKATLKAFKPNHSGLSSARTRLAFMLRHEGVLDQAEKLARRKLDDLSASLGGNHMATVNACENLALTLLQRKREEQPPIDGGAREPRQEASEPHRSMKRAAPKAEGKPHRAKYAKTGKAGSARFASTDRAGGARFARAAEAATTREPPQSTTDQQPPPSSAPPSALADDDEVVKLQRQVLRAREAAQGSPHPDTIFARANLAATLRQRGQLDEAAELLRSVEAAQVHVLGTAHPDVVRT